ncbi:MAG: peptidoglycan DD-metalloendopeptidase family protein [bacterium]
MFKKIIIFLFIASLSLIITKVLFAFDEPALKEYSIEETNAEIMELNIDIESKKDELNKLNSKQEAYQQEIRYAQSKQASLDNQIAILDNRVADAQISIDKVKLNIEKVNLEIKKIDLEIRAKDKKIEQEKEQLAVAIKLLYQQGNKSDLEIILSHDNLSDYLDQIKYLKDINTGITDSLDDLRENQVQLAKNKEELEKKESSLNQLKDDLSLKQGGLTAEQDSKTFLLSQTKSSEKEYQRLLELAKQEQEQASTEIAALEKTIREKLSRMDNNQLDEHAGDSEGLIWPISKNTITAYFHDPDYPFRHLFEHPAIDIRAGQGTQIKAADFGYVARTKFDGDNSYAYIMIVHSNGLATVYGHVSKIYVQEDEYVSQGQVIGLTGGTPGTPGCGRLSTGPHLHFEVRLDGIPVNPLEYLP